MKKILTFSAVLMLSTCLVCNAASYADAFKKAVKQDIQASKQEVSKLREAAKKDMEASRQEAKNIKADYKEAIKKDIEAKKQENIKVQEAKKQAKIKEIDSKVNAINKEIASINANKNMTNIEKTIKINALNKQIKFYQDQKEALK